MKRFWAVSGLLGALVLSPSLALAAAGDTTQVNGIISVTNTDLGRIPMASSAVSAAAKSSMCAQRYFANSVKGKVLLQTQSNNEAWYVDPVTCYRSLLDLEALVTHFLESVTVATPSGVAPTGEPTPAPTPAPTPTPAPAPAPVPQPVSTNGLFAGATLFNSGAGRAISQVADWQVSRPADAVLMGQIASQPTGTWFGDWNQDVRKDVDSVVTAAAAAQAIPVLVAYSIPDRDCGSGYSAGGVENAADYHTWMSAFAEGIGSRKAIVILEPDAVALGCFTDARGAMLTDAVKVLEAKPGVSVYIDAGHPNWTPAAEMAKRLQKSGISQATGFALNVSNFYKTSENITFGNTLSALVGGKHYVIDTSRNGNGWQGEWCNPQGAAIGESPSLNTVEPLLDAKVWAKPPGASDGNCNGGPSAGSWWGEYALRLINNRR